MRLVKVWYNAHKHLTVVTVNTANKLCLGTYNDHLYKGYPILLQFIVMYAVLGH